MPSDDLVLSVRQIAGYPPATTAVGATLVAQIGGLGGPYVSMSAQQLVSEALASGGDMAIAGALQAQSVSGGSAQFSNGAFGFLSASKACVNGASVLTVRDNYVSMFNGRIGPISLLPDDILFAGGAPSFSPRFSGEPRADTPPEWSNSTRLATTEYVQRNTVLYLNNLLDCHPFVFTFNGRSGAVVLTPADLAGMESGFAPLDSPNFTGDPTAPTAATGSSTGQIATTAFVMNAVSGSVAGVASFNARTGSVTLLGTDIAAVPSPSLSGVPTAPTASPGTNSNQIATTAFVLANGGGGGSLDSPAFTGVPTAPTAPLGTNSQQLATTAFVLSEITAIDAGVLSFNGRSGLVTLLANDLSAVGGALTASPVFTGVPTAPTASPGTTSTQIATCGFVAASGGGGVMPPGITNGSNASAGQVGEVISSVNSSGAGVPAGSATTVTSITLTAGDWDVQGEAWITTSAAPSATSVCINASGAVLPTLPQINSSRAQGLAQASGVNIYGVTPCRVNVTVSTICFLVAFAQFASGTATATGKIWARRAR